MLGDAHYRMLHLLSSFLRCTQTLLGELCRTLLRRERKKKGEINQESDGREGGERRAQACGSTEYWGILWEVVCEPEEALWHLEVRILRGKALRILGVSPSIWVCH